MKKNYTIGLVAQIDHDSEDFIFDKEIRFRFNHFRNKTNTIVFDWTDLDEEGYVSKYIFGDGKRVEFRQREKLDNICDLVHVGQMGKLFHRKNEFLKFLDYLDNYKGRVINPVQTLRYNSSKQYLINLYSKGLPVIPSFEINKGDSFQELRSVLSNGFAGKEFVIKPLILGEGGNDVKLESEFKDSNSLTDYISRVDRAIVQPLISEVYKNGEDSLIFFNGKLSHALNKFSGELRVNDIGNLNKVKYKEIKPSKKQLENARLIMENWPTPFDFVRIDMIGKDNSLISEVEMINPDLYEIDIGIMGSFIFKLEEMIEKVMK